MSSFSGTTGCPIVQAPLSAGLNILHCPVTEPDWIETINEIPATSFIPIAISLTAATTASYNIGKIGTLAFGQTFVSPLGSITIKVVYPTVASDGTVGT